MVEVAHAHQPVIVVDGVREDQYGQPASWYYHVECLACGVDLPEVEVEVDIDALTDRRWAAKVAGGQG